MVITRRKILLISLSILMTLAAHSRGVAIKIEGEGTLIYIPRFVAYALTMFKTGNCTFLIE